MPNELSMDLFDKLTACNVHKDREIAHHNLNASNKIIMTTNYIAASDVESKMAQMAHLIAELNGDVGETQRLTLISFCEDGADG